MQDLISACLSAGEEIADRPAIICGDRTVTHARLQSDADQAAASLRRLGIGPACKVALLFPTEPEFVSVFFGVLKAGGVPCPLNADATEEELTQLFDVIQPDLLITADGLSDAATRACRALAARCLTATQLQHVAPSVDPLATAPDPALHDVAVILCTSGTTGLPKAAMLTHDNLVSNLHAFRDHLGRWPYRSWSEPEVFGNPIPLFHPYGLIMMTLMPLYLRGTSVLIPRFSPANCLQSIQDHKITFFGGVPSMYAMLNRYRRRGDYDASSCRIWITGGSALPAAVESAFAESFGVRICDGFGMLETSSLASLNFEDPPRHDGSVGPLHLKMKAQIRDEDDRVLEPGQSGELWLSGPNIMKGYYRNPQATDEALRDGWLKTGDLGFFDDDGHLHLMGRSKEMMIVSGHNVYPREIENVLMDVRSISDAAVAARSDPVRGESILAFVVSVDGGKLQETALLEACRRRLSAYKVPRQIYVVPSIPRNPSGKILRSQLVEQYT